MLVYEAYNTLNGKAYIGITTNTLEKRKSSHIRSSRSKSNSVFHKAIRKYGEDAFEWSVIATASSLKSLYSLEKLFISLFERWQLYNVSLGGEHSAYGLKHSKETKELCGSYARKRWDSKRAKDLYPEECFLTASYKEAKLLFGVPKTTWYRYRRIT